MSKPIEVSHSPWAESVIAHNSSWRYPIYCVRMSRCFLFYSDDSVVLSELLTGGLVYLPCGVGGMIAAYATGKSLDRDYVRTAKRHHLPIDKSSNDLSNFPIEQARLLSVFPLLAISTIATVGYGWAINQHASIAVPLTLTLFSGASQIAIFTVCGTLLTELNPN